MNKTGIIIDTITVPGSEMEVVHVIIYIETVQWAVKSFEVIRVTPSLLLYTGTCWSVCENIHHYSLEYISLH